LVAQTNIPFNFFTKTMKCIRCKLINPVNTPICKRCYTPLLNNVEQSNESQDGIYRDSNLLVIELRASLPKRCYKCNSPNIIDYETQELEYVPYLQKRIKWAAGAITSAAKLLPLTPGRRTMELHLHACSEHRSIRPRLFVIGAIAVVLSVLVLFISARILSDYGEIMNYITIVTAVLFTIGIMILVWGSYLESVSVDKYRDSYFWVKGFNEEYLKSFPNLTDAQKKFDGCTEKS
jgi:hypothetical protein